MTDIPRWGRVVARPHEFLIHLRGGRLKTSGHGRSCFKWPWDSVAVIPTSISKLSFKADQITREKVGVEVTGLAVYRIADPLLAYRMLDLDRASLTEILRDMFIGATRRIVANLTVDECITHRKERVADALTREIAPVLAGVGAIDDATATGWGVILDTLEIQDVRVLSQEVFARLQAPYREKLALDALRAKDEVAREEAALAAARAKNAEHARRALMADEEARLSAERRRSEEAHAHAQLLARRKLEAELAARRESGELEAELEAMRRKANAELLGDERLREVFLTETVPAIAQAFRGSFDRVNVSLTDRDLPLAAIAPAIERVLAGVASTGPRKPA